MHKRIIVIDISETRDDLRVLINPEIVAAEGEAECEEGCLSVPGYYDKVDPRRPDHGPGAERARRTVRADAEGLLAVCIQHEMDHLSGKIFVDYLRR